MTVSEHRPTVDAIAPAAASSRLGDVIGEFRRGWWIVLAGTLGTSVSVLTSTYALALLMGPLEAAQGWSRSAIAIASSFFTVGIFLAGPWWGKLYDRFGIRRIGPTAVVLLALSHLGITFVGGEIWGLYLGYLCLGVLGAGTSYVAYARAVNSRFDRGRGVALAITMAGSALAAAVQPLVLPGLMAAHGWRAGYYALAASALLALPLMLFVLKERPQAPPSASAAAARLGSAAPALGVTLGVALRSRPFWLMAAGIFLVGMSLVGTHLHLSPMLRDRGASPEAAAQTLALMGIGVLAGRFISGALLDSFRAPLVAAFLFSIPTVVLTLFLGLDLRFAPILGLALGVATGAEADVLGYLASRYFGMKHYSEIFGWLFGAMALGSACGPLLTGSLYSLTGSYTLCLMVSAVLCGIAAVLFASLGAYPKPAETPASAP